MLVFYYNSSPICSFIKAHPEYQKKFSKFANVPQAELMDNGNFLAQAYTIMAGLNVVIQSLSSSELLASQLNALGGAHQPRGITPTMFEVCFGDNLRYHRIKLTKLLFNSDSRNSVPSSPKFLKVS